MSCTPAGEAAKPLVAHVIFRLGTGGLENGLVNLINRMPAERYDHAVVCITNRTDFATRIERPDVEIVDIRKQPGTDLAALRRLYSTFRRLRPAVVHTRNLAALDALLPARLAGVRRTIHGEHGRDINDLHGRNRKLRWLRILHRPLISRYVALSKDLQTYLVETIGVPAQRIVRICNGVDPERFRPGSVDVENGSMPSHIFAPDTLVIGTVGRLEPVKNPIALVDAFRDLVTRRPELAAKARLVIVGEGSLRVELERRIDDYGLAEVSWIAGDRTDVANLLRGFDVFVQPSLVEGISNTVLEAMATGVPVVATNVGGNAELVAPGDSGTLVTPADRHALSSAIEHYALNPTLRRGHGNAARERAKHRFSIDVMVQDYLNLYDECTRPGKVVARTMGI